MESILEKNTLERADRLFCCDEVHQSEPTGILEQRNIRMIAKGHICSIVTVSYLVPQTEHHISFSEYMISCLSAGGCYPVRLSQKVQQHTFLWY